MPELPEVQTTVNGIKNNLLGLKIIDIWSDYPRKNHDGKDNIKDARYLKDFKEKVTGTKIVGASRQGKNVLIHLSNEKTILVHMKMTGHLMYGKYSFADNRWIPEQDGALKDPYNRFIRLAFSLSNGKHLVLSDTRRFGKVQILENGNGELKKLGPDPLLIDFEKFKSQIAKKPKGKIKTVLMDQEILAGIGNIYSDEILWESAIHPEQKITDLNDDILKKIFISAQKILKKGIKAGGDSMSDYRNIFGEKGKFQNFHKAYKKTGQKCLKKGCEGIIKRIKVGGRSTHFCEIHQKILK